MTILAKRLKQSRKKAGLSQEKLGILAGIDEASASSRMNHYEKCRHTPDFLMLKGLAKVLGLPVAYFYAEDDDLARAIEGFNKLDNESKKSILVLIDVFSVD